VTYHVFPLDKNRILVRFTNLADKFDAKTAQLGCSLDLDKWALEFYNEANPQLAPATPKTLKTMIFEVNLSSNQLQSTVEQNRPTFRGIDDAQHGP
jgi:hypothetical protein